MSTEEKLAGEALIDHVCNLALGYGATGREDVKAEYLAAKDDLKAEHARLSAEVQELRAERDMAERAAAEAAIPLEALMMAGQGYLSDAVWDEVRNGVGHVRSMLTARAKRRAALKPETVNDGQ